MFGFFKWLFGTDTVTPEESIKSLPEQAAPPAKYKWNAKQISAMTKVELDAHAAENGVKLDRRKKKKDMIADFRAALKDQGLL